MDGDSSSPSASSRLSEHHEPGDQAAGVRRGPGAGFALTWVAGCVDAVGYMTLQEVYLANMSGNSIAVGMGWQSGQPLKAWQHGFPVLMFVVGLMAGGALMELGRRCQWRRVFSLALLLEAACLAAFLLCSWQLSGNTRQHEVRSSGVFALLVALAALAMGIQNASLTKMGALTIHTTHVTGALTRMAEEIVGFVFWLADHLRKHPRLMLRSLGTVLRQRSLRETLHLAGLWVGYVLGATSGSVGLHFVGLLVMVVPLFVLLTFALFTQGGGL